MGAGILGALVGSVLMLLPGGAGRSVGGGGWGGFGGGGWGGCSSGGGFGGGGFSGGGGSFGGGGSSGRSEEHTSELQSLLRISNAVFCSKKKQDIKSTQTSRHQ